MTDILHKPVSLPQFSGNFVQLHFLLHCQHRQYRMTMLTGCNQLYSHLPLISMRLGVTWLKSHSTESLEECTERLSSRPAVTARDSVTILAKGMSCRATNCVQNVRSQTKAFYIWGITVDLSRSWSEWLMETNSPGQQHAVWWRLVQSALLARNFAVSKEEGLICLQKDTKGANF